MSLVKPIFTGNIYYSNMRMNVTIEGKQSQMSIKDQQRTRRCLNVLKDIGFDIRLDFTESDDQPLPAYSHPPIDGEYISIAHKRQLALHMKNGITYGVI